PLSLRCPPAALAQGGCLPLVHVPAHLDEARPRQVETQRSDAGEATVLLAHDARDRPRDLDVIGAQIDVEGDERPASAHQHCAGCGIEPRWPEVRRQLPGVDPPLQLLRPTPTEKRWAAPWPAVEKDRQAELADPTG